MLQRDYGPTSRMLHRAALGLPGLLQASFELETLLHTAKPSSSGRHVFIAGLARSGTTWLLRVFYATNQYQSLTYRHMPFVLMPNTWRQISRHFQTSAQETERAHGDGIQVNFDSPEAFDEVFWRAFCGNTYILEDRLVPQAPDPTVINHFRAFVGQVIAAAEHPARQRYLSKNNNSVLRLTMLREAFPEAMILVPFRDPVQQAVSLLHQHQRFVERHAEDPFARDYMLWLGHHEFGLTHKPFRFANESPDLIATTDTNDINYWLALWIRTYEYVLQQQSVRPRFVCYESLCDLQSHAVERLLTEAGIPPSAMPTHTGYEAPSLKPASALDPGLHARAAAVYADMFDRSEDEQRDDNNLPGSAVNPG